jgi:hypothetical protein
MTVIACNLEMMASDSLCHEDDTSSYQAEKMIRLIDGSILGGAGNHPEIVMDWIARGKPLNDKPSFDEEKDDFSVIHLTDNGIYLYNNSLVGFKLKEKNYAVGCGADIAIYCMRILKLTPDVAAKEATKINMFCGGDIDVLKL